MPPTKEFFLEKGRAWLAKADPAISGQGGHRAFFGAACNLVRLCPQLPEDDLFSLLWEYNEQCDPPFSERDVWHKLYGALGQRETKGVSGASSIPRLSPDLRRPPTQELLELWQKSPPISKDSEVVAWLRGRGFSLSAISTIEESDLARALPRLGKAYLPKWAGNGRELTWQKSDHRLLLPLYNISGQIESVRARRILPTQDGQQKELCPRGYNIKGLVMANESARLLLQGAPIEKAPVIIAEGSPDFLSWAFKHSGDGEQKAAVFGVFNGSWVIEFADKIPSGWDVIVRTHLDKAGEKYADEIIRTLVARCPIRRLKSQERATP